MPGRIAGISNFFVDENPITCNGKLVYNPTSTKREPKIAMDGTVVGYKETGDAAFMEVEVTNDGSSPISYLYALQGVQCVAILPNGGRVTGTNMYPMTDGSNKVDASEEAAFTLRFVPVNGSVTEDFS